jgi:hypothetical protein
VAVAVSPRVIPVPRTKHAIAIDGELEEPEWKAPARTGPFVDPKDGTEARPYSDARLLWDERFLYVAFYAADEDIRTATDKFELGLNEHTFVYPPKQKPGEAAVELDGTPDDPKDTDEEWIIEAKIPWAKLGVAPKVGARIALWMKRCDVPKDGAERCGEVGDREASVVLELR